MQPPAGTTQARFVFPKPPFALEGSLTVPFDLTEPEPAKPAKADTDAPR